MQDPDLNELLPFGEYVAPERLSSTTAPHFMVGLDAWELEHLLHRLVRARPPQKRSKGVQSLIRVIIL